MNNAVKKPGFFTRLFTKKDWRLVKKLEQRYRVVNSITGDTMSDNHSIVYYLFENQFGDRKFDVVDSQKGDLKVSSLQADDYAFRCELYLETVHGWLKGGYDPEIPNYYSVEHKNLLDTLRGRKEG